MRKNIFEKRMLVGLLSGIFFLFGWNVVLVQAVPDSELYFISREKKVVVNGDFSLDAMLNPGQNQVSAVELHVKFDQNKFRLDNVETNGSPFSVTLQKANIDNASGVASLVVGIPANNPVVPITVASKIASFFFHSLVDAEKIDVDISEKSKVAALEERGDVLKREKKVDQLAPTTLTTETTVASMIHSRYVVLAGFLSAFLLIGYLLFL